MYLRSYFIGYLHHFRNRRARWQQPLRSGGGGFDSSLLLAFISVQRSMFLRWWLLVAAMATAAVQASTNSQVRLPYRLHTADVIGRTYERPVPPAPADTSLVGLDLNHTRSQRPANQWLVADGDRLFVVRTTYHAEGYHYGRLDGNISLLFTGQFVAANQRSENSTGGDIICITHSNPNATDSVPPATELTCYDLELNDTEPSLAAVRLHTFVHRRLWSQPNFLLNANGSERVVISGSFLSRANDGGLDQILAYDSDVGNASIWHFRPKTNRFEITAFELPVFGPGKQIRTGDFDRASPIKGATALTDLAVFDTQNGTLQIFINSRRQMIPQPIVTGLPITNPDQIEFVVLQLQSNQNDTAMHVRSAIVFHNRTETRSVDRKYSIAEWNAESKSLVPFAVDTSEWSLEAGVQLHPIRIKMRNETLRTETGVDDVLHWSPNRELFSVAAALRGGLYRWIYTQRPIVLDTDADGDGILTRYELGGLDGNLNRNESADGISDEPLHLYGASPFSRDVFVEIDYMKNNDSNWMMLESSAALAIREFAKKGMNLHLFLSDAIPFIEMLGTEERQIVYDWETFFDPLKYRWFTPSRWGLFRYVIFGSRHNGVASQVSGRSRGIPGSDFLVTLGGWPSRTGTIQEQAGTFLHELGHNLGLRHGGLDNIGGKPNHLSIMNHIFQIVGVWKEGKSQWLYSETDCDDLDENDLDENTGVTCRGIRTAGDGRGGTKPGSGEDLSDFEQTLIEFTLWTPLNSPVDFDRNGRLENHIKYDLNHDTNFTRLIGATNEYAALRFDGLGAVGAPSNISELSITPTGGRYRLAPFSPYSHRLAGMQGLALDVFLRGDFLPPPSQIPKRKGPIAPPEPSETIDALLRAIAAGDAVRPTPPVIHRPNFRSTDFHATSDDGADAAAGGGGESAAAAAEAEIDDQCNELEYTTFAAGSKHLRNSLTTRHKHPPPPPPLPAAKPEAVETRIVWPPVERLQSRRREPIHHRPSQCKSNYLN